jgi:membrane-associated phospholipid phosphatase
MERPAVGQQLLPGRFRRAAIAVICVAVTVVAGLGALFAHHTQASAFDNAVSNLLQANGGFGPGGPSDPGRLLRPFGMLGSTVPMALVTALLVYCCLALRRYWGAVLVAASVIVASSLSEFVLKPIIDRTRYGSLSFPSGHATAIFAIATAVAVLLIRPPGTNMPPSMRRVLAVLTYLAAAAGALGLVEIHYFTDTIGGAAVGTGVTLAIALALDRLGASGRQARAAADASAAPARVA